MKKFAFFSDIIFTFFTGSILTLVLFRYLGVGLFLSFALAILCGALAALAVGALLRLRRKNLLLKQTEEGIREKLLLHLALLSDEEKTALFMRVLSTDEEPVKRFGKLRIFNKTEFFFLKFTLSPLVADEIPNLARLKTGKKKILLCSSIDEQALVLCQRLDIEVRTGEWSYSLLKKREALPESYLGEGVKPKVKKKAKAWFSKKNAKRFLVSGSLILLLSRLTPFYYYYLATGLLLLLTAIVVRIFGYAEQSPVGELN